MSENVYTGEERRVSPYEQFCKPAFVEIKEDIKHLRGETDIIKQKLFNGLSELPAEVKSVRGEVKWIQRLIVTLLISIILGGGAGVLGWVAKFSALETQLHTISKHLEEK